MNSRVNQSPCRGAAVVEFAVIAPLFFMLLFGIIEIGRALYIAHVGVNGSREGARHAVISTTTSVSEVEQRVKQYLEGAGVPQAAVSVQVQNETAPGTYQDTADLSSVKQGTAVRVQVGITFVSVSWLPSMFMAPDAVVTGATVMRKETD